MRICHITDGLPPLQPGGAGQIVLSLSQGQAARGHTIHIITAGDAPAVEGVTVHTLTVLPKRWAHYRSVYSICRSEQVLQAIAEAQPDIIHAHAVALQIGYRWIDQTEIPCIFTAHDAMTVAYGKVTANESPLWLKDILRGRWTFNPLRNGKIHEYLSHCSRILAVSSALATYLSAHGISQPQVLHNGIDLDFWRSAVSRAEARSRLGVSPNACVFLLAGRIGVDKGSKMLPCILPAQAHLIVAGSTPAALTTLQDRLHFFASQSPDRMRLLYAACDAVLVPSQYLDPFPTVCLEAMAMQRPVIATSWGGAKEAVKDNETGWILDPMDEDAWAMRMAWCTTHRDELKKFGEAGRKRMEQQFSLEHFIDQLEQIYTDCLNR